MEKISIRYNNSINMNLYCARLYYILYKIIYNDSMSWEPYYTQFWCTCIWNWFIIIILKKQNNSWKSSVETYKSIIRMT